VAQFQDDVPTSVELCVGHGPVEVVRHGAGDRIGGGGVHAERAGGQARRVDRSESRGAEGERDDLLTTVECHCIENEIHAGGVAIVGVGGTGQRQTGGRTSSGGQHSTAAEHSHANSFVRFPDTCSCPHLVLPDASPMRQKHRGDTKTQTQRHDGEQDARDDHHLKDGIPGDLRSPGRGRTVTSAGAISRIDREEDPRLRRAVQTPSSRMSLYWDRGIS
jgi:hypothetical protein